MNAFSNTQTPHYQFVGEFDRVRDHWLDQARLWRDSIASLVLECAEPLLLKIPASFFIATPKLVFRTLRHQVKTHKSLSVTNGRFASRPLAGLSSWGTTRASELMAAFGNTLLALDAHLDPIRTPLRDSFDFATQLRTMAFNSESTITTCDFDSLYTNVSWINVQVGFYFWYEWFTDLQPHQPSQLSPIERNLVDLMFSPVPDTW